ncbi:hypothetical protein HZB01_02950 [Candidatus Woesearchaeota archaeon]|nr:hypothetical protein [Candidatus Woesearchaeota archaeon]
MIPLHMGHFIIMPSWFYGFNVLFEIIFTIITLVVGLYALKVYKISDQPSSKFFGIAFLFISAAYLVRSAVNLVLMLTTEASGGTSSSGFIHYTSLIGIYLHIALFIIGLSTFAYMTLKINNMRVLSLLLAILILAIIFSSNTLFMYYLLSSLLLFYITIYYLDNYFQSRQYKTLLALIAFVFLLFGKIHFIFALNHGTYYAIGYFLEFAAYGLLLTNVMRVIRNNEQEKRPATDHP